ncbi:AraC family transcriptional regulator [Winogradskyella sp. DF17]|uniref:AraC family transcriptional regulator n=2 Tax=Winogradskyella pelagia TaxID=2819984 RepID=A0ABS3SYY4_9FLAO|nr:AraC family transcriptional regulator [Winogradskyella sp. DF17]
MKPLELVFIILLSIGALQGLIYGAILWINQNPNRTANRFLATILFFFSYRLIVEIFKLFGLGNYDIFYHVFLEFNWIYGALIYFFTKAYVSPQFKLSFKYDWIHFLPVLIEFLWSNFIKTQNFFWDGTRESLSWLGYWGYVVWMHYPTQYIISAGLVIFYILKSERMLSVKDYETYQVIPHKTDWISRILRIMKWYAITILLVVLIDFIFLDYAFNRSYHYPIFIGMALITYWLGLEGFNRKQDIVLKQKYILNDKETAQLKPIADKLKSIMIEAKVFKNPDLTLNILSESIEEKSYLVTKCLNLLFHKKFNDFVNEYRIEELKLLLKDPKNSNFTLLSLAFEAGFNSKASFNRAVKKLTGQSPSHLKSEN